MGKTSAEIKEIAVLAILACLGLVLAWAHEDGFFAPVFAAETVFAVIAAVYSYD